MIIVNFEYQKEKARKIKKRIDELQGWVKSLDNIIKESQDDEYRDEITIPILLRDFNNELDDLARILNNMKVSGVEK